MQSQISEVARARAHMRRQSEKLAGLRRFAIRGAPNFGVTDQILAQMALIDAETEYFAALSWVWDAQQREVVNDGYDALAAVVRARHAELVGPPTRARACR